LLSQAPSHKGPQHSLRLLRTAQKELPASPGKVREWFAELEHYGFIVLHRHACVREDGGKAPHWRLTELGTTSKASAEGLFEPPTLDFLKWDGTKFKPPKSWRTKGEPGWLDGKKVKSPVTYVSNAPLRTSVAPPLRTSVAVETESVTHGVHIQGEESVTHVDSISSLTTPPPTSAPPTDPSLEEKSIVGRFEEQSNVVHLDERIAALEATEKKRKLK
jgi:hypothetical protein